MTQEKTKERLIEVFTFEKPHMLRFEYRKQSFKEWKKALFQLIKDGSVKLIHKDSNSKIYQYLGTKQ